MEFFFFNDFKSPKNAQTPSRIFVGNKRRISVKVHYGKET